MTTARGIFQIIYQKQKIYAVGGMGGSNSMESYDLKTRTWTKESIPFGVYGHCIAQLSADQFILIGGYSNGVSKNVITKNI